MRLAVPLLALLALSTVLASPAAAATAAPTAAAADGHAAAPSPAPAVPPPDAAPARPRLSSPANTTIEIDVRPNRSARWRITMTYALESRNETAAFRRVAEDYRNNDTTVGPRAALFRRIVDAASAATGRPMAVRDVSRQARVGGSTGSLSLSFLWTGMLERTGNRTIRLGDAVRLPANRTWIDSLERGQTLVIRTPEGYSLVDSDAPSFELRNNSVVISGPVRIDGTLAITYRRTGPTGPTGDAPWGVLAGLVIAGVLVAGAIFMRRRRPRPGDRPARDDAGRPDAPASGDAAGGDGTGADADAGAADGPTGTEQAPDPELLSDEERVERLLRANDGRMKQAAIVRETGWSDAKVSQLLSSMADEGRIDKLRLGRENLISLPDEDDRD
ncbi:MAG: helix-turn-helix transcriptional regulator [Haloferacaceae archaeon]